MCFCNKTVVSNFCSGDDNVHELICTKTKISNCKSHTRRHKHQDLVKKTLAYDWQVCPRLIFTSSDSFITL